MQFAFFLYVTRYALSGRYPVQVQKGHGMPPIQRNIDRQIIITR